MNIPLGIETQLNPILGNIEDALPLFTWIEGFANPERTSLFSGGEIVGEFTNPVLHHLAPASSLRRPGLYVPLLDPALSAPICAESEGEAEKEARFSREGRRFSRVQPATFKE